MQVLTLLSVGSKLAKFLMSFFKTEVSSFSNFASLFIVMTHNPSVLFWLKYNILSTKVVHQIAKFSDLPMLALKFTKFFMSLLEPRVSFSTFVLCHLKIFILWAKGAHQSANF